MRIGISLDIALVTGAITDSGTESATEADETCAAAGAWSFVPSTLGSGSLVLDLNADNIAGSDGATLTTWADDSGLTHTCTLVGSPTLKLNILGTNTKKVVRFNGTTQSGEIDSIASIMNGADKPCTVVLVCSYRTAPQAASGILCAWSSSGSSTPFFALAQEGSKWETDRRDDAAGRNTIARQASTNAAHIIALNFTGIADTIQVDGVNGASDPVTDNLGTMTIDQFTIAAWKIAGVITFAPLDINRVLVYSAALSAQDMATAKLALAQIVGITVT